MEIQPVLLQVIFQVSQDHRIDPGSRKDGSESTPLPSLYYTIDTHSGTDTKRLAETPSVTGDGIGTAAIGQTSTYSSHPLPKGDTVGSVINTSSNDPITYQMPEHTYRSGAGVPLGAAGTAASIAFNKDRDQSRRCRINIM